MNSSAATMSAHKPGSPQGEHNNAIFVDTACHRYQDVSSVDVDPVVCLTLHKELTVPPWLPLPSRCRSFIAACLNSGPLSYSRDGVNK